MRLKQLPIFILTLLFVNSAIAQSRLDSIRVYIIPFDLENKTPISSSMVKTFPLTTSYVILDSTKLSQVLKAIKVLKKSDIKWEVFDERMLCELYSAKKKRTLLINHVKYVQYLKKMYMPSDSLLNNLSQ